jgi:hypothetical protein
MKNSSTELDKLQSSLKIQFLCFIGVVILAVIGSYFSYKVGYINRSLEVAGKAKEVTNQDKDCYTLQDIEIIAFGEPQL